MAQVTRKRPAGALLEIETEGRLSETAYRRILELLFDRRLPAGAFVSQNELVQLTGVPVAPLRDALRILEAEGVLTIQPRSGIQFVKPGLELTKSTYQFRTIIERAAVRVFAETANDEILAALKQSHAALQRRIEKDGLNEKALTELERLEGQLHNSVIGILRNPLIESSYRRIRNYLRPGSARSQVDGTFGAALAPGASCDHRRLPGAQSGCCRSSVAGPLYGRAAASYGPILGSTAIKLAAASNSGLRCLPASKRKKLDLFLRLGRGRIS